MELVALGKGGLVLGPEIRVGWLESPTKNHPGTEPAWWRGRDGAAPHLASSPLTESRRALAYSFLSMGKSAFRKVSNKHIHLEASELYRTVPGGFILYANVTVNLREPNGRSGWV